MSNSEERKWKVYMHVVPKELSGYSYDKYYIGITQQKLTKRWQHGCGYYSCTFFYKAIQKYGWDNMEHLVVAEDLSEIEAKEMEVELIAKYNSNNSKYGYNLTKGGDGTVGRMKTEEEKEMHRRLSKEVYLRPGYVHPNKGKKMSEKQKEALRLAAEKRRNDPNYVHPRKGIPMSEENKEKLRKPRPQISGKNSPTAKIIYQYDLDMNLIKEYPCVKDAAKETGIGYRTILLCVSGESKTAGGYVWKYKSGKINKRNYESSNKKPVSQYTLDGELIKTYESASKAAKELGLNSNNIRKACKGKINSSGGFLWAYPGEEAVYKQNFRKDVAQYSLNGELVAVYQSGAEAYRKTGVNSSEISLCCNGKRKTSGGYIWKFYNPDSGLLEKAE